MAHSFTTHSHPPTALDRTGTAPAAGERGPAAPPKATFRNLPLAKRQRIISEAIREFAENGYQRASLNSIVRRLGIAKGSIYQYFDNKEALFLHLFDLFTDFVKETVRREVSPDTGFFLQVRQVLLAGIRFIDERPEFFQLYLNVLFEQDVPFREELIARVRLFSMDYFGPLYESAKQRGEVRSDLTIPMMAFAIDAVVDRFLQGYARSYLDGGLALAGKSNHELTEAVDTVIGMLQNGLAPGNKQGDA